MLFKRKRNGTERAMIKSHVSSEGDRWKKHERIIKMKGGLYYTH